MGEATLNNRFNTDGKESISYKIPSLHVGYSKETPIQQLSLYGKAGVSAIQNKASSSSVPFKKQTNIQLSYGLGAQWDALYTPLFVRLGTDFYARDARATNLSLGYNLGALKRAAPKIPRATAIPAALPIYKPRATSTQTLDTDGDGFVDKADHCPLSKRGAAVDHRGCEINLPKPTFSGVLDGVNFHTGSTVLTPTANRILKQVARQFKRCQTSKLLLLAIPTI